MFELPFQVRNINKKLKELYGKHADGRPYFRLAWPQDQREHRFGDFNYFTSSGLFARTERNVIRERKKYPHIRDRWILEMLTFPPKQLMWGPELHGVENGSYECLWNFAFKEYRIPEFDAVQCLVKHALYGDKAATKLSPEEMAAFERMQEEMEDQESFDYLDNESPDLAHAIKHGEAVFNDSTKSLESKTNG